MIDVVKDIIQSPAGSFGSVTALFLLAFWLVHWITKKVTSINFSHDALSVSVKKMEGHIEKMQEDIVYLKVNVDIIKASTQPLSQSKSPLSLTALGQKASEDLKATEMIANSWDKIYADLEANVHSLNAYDIQQYCTETATVELSRFISEDNLSRVKMYAFENGKPFAYYAPVFAIPIRDRYLKLKGIDVAEVGKEAPNTIK
jgi:hypothetical protein